MRLRAKCLPTCDYGRFSPRIQKAGRIAWIIRGQQVAGRRDSLRAKGRRPLVNAAPICGLTFGWRGAVDFVARVPCARSLSAKGTCFDLRAEWRRIIEEEVAWAADRVVRIGDLGGRRSGCDAGIAMVGSQATAEAPKEPATAEQTATAAAVSAAAAKEAVAIAAAAGVTAIRAAAAARHRSASHAGSTAHAAAAAAATARRALLKQTATHSAPRAGRDQEHGNERYQCARHVVSPLRVHRAIGRRSGPPAR
jgi:hypothetical protein